MNYTINEANKIRVGDTLTLEDGSVHEAVSGILGVVPRCDRCSMYKYTCSNIQCSTKYFHFKQIKP